MQIEINSFDFVNIFKKSDTYKNNFSNLGLYYLYKHLENYEEETEETIIVDMVAICCEFTEYENIEDIMSDYGLSAEEIYNSTEVISIYDVDNEVIGYIIRDF